MIVDRRTLVRGGVAASIAALAGASAARADNGMGGNMAGMNSTAGQTPTPVAVPVVNQVLTVQLKDMSIKLADVPSIKAGQSVLFIVINADQTMSHEFMIFKMADYKMLSSMPMDMSSMDAAAVGHIEVNKLPPLSDGRLTVTFKEAGQYMLACMLKGHEKMRYLLTVTG